MGKDDYYNDSYKDENGFRLVGGAASPDGERDFMPPVVYTGKRAGKKGFAMRKAAALFVSFAIFGSTLGLGLGYGLNKFAPAAAPASSDTVSAAVAGNTVSGAQTSGYIPTNVAATTTSSVSDVYKKVESSVVSVNTMVKSTSGYFGQQQDLQGAGSGIIFKEDAAKVYIVTNYHVVDGAYSVTVSLDDTTTFTAHAVGGDPTADIAVLYVNKSDLTAKNVKYTIATFGDSDKTQIGDAAMAIGNALGEGKSATFGIISTGIKQIMVDATKYDVIQTDAAINPGNSGGPLVNMNGEVIGINAVKITDTDVEGMGYAIPINNVKTLINTILTSGSVQRPYLGITPQDIDETTKSQYNLPSVGIYVYSVDSGSTAAIAGLTVSDIITAINGKTVVTTDDLSTAINAIKVGDKFTITVVRTTYSGGYFRQQTQSTQTVTLNATMQQYQTSLNF